MINILVADDNESIRKLIAAYLIRAGYEVCTACDGREALDILHSAKIDLLIADVMMPGMDGFDLTRELRESKSTIPVLMVTAKERIEDKARGFQAGTDDYMVKPIDFDEMLLRVAALLRRAKISNERRITLGSVTLDWDTLTVTRNGEAALLPKKEFYLLFKLLSYPRKIFTRQDLMDEIWGFDNETDERTVDVHIKRLREKFEDFPEFKIVTIRGLGYKAEKCV
jgi:two-component system, OmpR family, response regulator